MKHTAACPFDANLVLGADPFAGDFGDDERVLKDVVGRTREDLRQ